MQFGVHHGVHPSLAEERRLRLRDVDYSLLGLAALGVAYGQLDHIDTALDLRLEIARFGRIFDQNLQQLGPGGAAEAVLVGLVKSRQFQLLWCRGLGQDQSPQFDQHQIVQRRHPRLQKHLRLVESFAAGVVGHNLVREVVLGQFLVDRIGAGPGPQAARRSHRLHYLLDIHLKALEGVDRRPELILAHGLPNHRAP